MKIKNLILIVAAMSLMACKQDPAGEPAAKAPIKIDGDFSDWTEIEPCFSKPNDRYAEFKLISDQTYIYFYMMFDVEFPADGFEYGFYPRIYIDTDYDDLTGKYEYQQDAKTGEKCGMGCDVQVFWYPCGEGAEATNGVYDKTTAVETRNPDYTFVTPKIFAYFRWWDEVEEVEMPDVKMPMGSDGYSVGALKGERWAEYEIRIPLADLKLKAGQTISFYTKLASPKLTTKAGTYYCFDVKI